MYNKRGPIDVRQVQPKLKTDTSTPSNITIFNPQQARSGPRENSYTRRLRKIIQRFVKFTRFQSRNLKKHLKIKDRFRKMTLRRFKAPFFSNTRSNKSFLRSSALHFTVSR